MSPQGPMLPLFGLERRGSSEEITYNWDELVKVAKELERSIDVGLLTLSRHHHAKSPTASKPIDVASLEASIKRLASVIEMMTELLEHVGTDGSQAVRHVSAHHLLSRHREICEEYRKELRKAKV